MVKYSFWILGDASQRPMSKFSQCFSQSSRGRNCKMNQIYMFIQFVMFWSCWWKRLNQTPYRVTINLTWGPNDLKQSTSGCFLLLKLEVLHWCNEMTKFRSDLVMHIVVSAPLSVSRIPQKVIDGFQWFWRAVWTPIGAESIKFWNYPAWWWRCNHVYALAYNFWTLQS